MEVLVANKLQNFLELFPIVTVQTTACHFQEAQ
jgi:hypothetical protein